MASLQANSSTDGMSTLDACCIDCCAHPQQPQMASQTKSPLLMLSFSVRSCSCFVQALR